MKRLFVFVCSVLVAFLAAGVVVRLIALERELATVQARVTKLENVQR